MPRVLLIHDESIDADGIYQALADSGYEDHSQSAPDSGGDAACDAIVIDDKMTHGQVMLDLAPFAMLFVNDQGAIVALNAQVEQIFGYSHGEMTGLSIELLIPERFRNVHLTHRNLPRGRTA